MNNGSIVSFENLILKNNNINGHPNLAGNLTDYLEAVSEDGYAPADLIIDAIFELAPSNEDAQLILEEMLDQFREEGLSLAITSDGGSSQASIEIDENSTFVTNVVAEDPNEDTVSYSITGGSDAALFQIDEETGELSFIAPPDFENSTDSDFDGIYEVVVRADDDGSRQFASQTISITVEDIIEASDFDSTVIGTDASDEIIGDGGSNEISVFGLDDGEMPVQYLNMDLLSGGLGVDQVIGDSTNLWVAAYDPSGVESLVSATIFAGDDSVSGGGGDDFVFGDSDQIVMDVDPGFSSDSVFDTQIITGTDTVSGGSGNDLILGDSYTATLLVYQEPTNGFSNETSQSLIASGDIVTGGDGADEIYGDFRNISITRIGTHGTDEQILVGGDDLISAGDGNDIVYGDFRQVLFSSFDSTATLIRTVEFGDDIINGGAGNDTLFGDGASVAGSIAGSDTFVFDLASGLDRIADFQMGTDSIDLSAYAFGGFSNINIAEVGGDTIIDLDGTAVDIDGIVLSNVTGLSVEDFIL